MIEDKSYEMNSKFWQIGEFHKLVDKRGLTTVDNWFKDLEKNKIHYIAREKDSDQKIYDETDAQILKYIDMRRREQIPLKIIMDELPNYFELRPFPIEEDTTDNAQVLDLAAIQKKFSDSIEKSVEEHINKGITQLKSELGEFLDGKMSSFLKQAAAIEENNRDKGEGREQRLIETLTARRVEAKLRRKALTLWTEKPSSERLIKTGLFSKSEDVNKRDLFVEEYIDQHYEEEFTKEMTKR
ncbi:hypothetical protein [Metabacillus fastidiosus]|uniref:MerR family transcriptional regulator n=1 Tax=Metabacillus fastidiosus TaxID=1458 RepID=A0ABU6NVD1_9BACI|nr:hypothetical protein [Metabacillus fastidiosus]MED4400322.1 MerR family transcriptional regulator [Metabacillus fastidiosus]